MSAVSFFTDCTCTCIGTGPAGPTGAAGSGGMPYSSGVGWSGAAGVFIANGLTAAIAIPSATTNLTLEINGLLTGGDGISHLYYVWDAVSVAAHAPDAVLASSDGGVGRWIQN